MDPCVRTNSNLRWGARATNASTFSDGLMLGSTGPTISQLHFCRAGTPPRSGGQFFNRCKQRKFFRPNPRIKKGLEKETALGEQKKTLSFTAKKTELVPEFKRKKSKLQDLLQNHFHAAMPPNPGLRRDLKKEWGLVARKSPCLELSFEKKMNCTPLTAGSDASSLRRRGGYAT